MMQELQPILEWISRLIRLAPRRVGQALATGVAVVILSTIVVLFLNFTAGDDLLPQQVARRLKLLLMVITAITVVAIIGLCLFL